MPTVGFRLSDEQHAELVRRAGDRSISRYLKEFLSLDDAGQDPIQELRDDLADYERRLSALEALAHAQGAYS